MLRCLAQRVLLFNSQLLVRRLTHAERFAAAVPLPLRAPRDSERPLPCYLYFKRTNVMLESNDATSLKMFFSRFEKPSV